MEGKAGSEVKRLRWAAVTQSSWLGQGAGWKVSHSVGDLTTERGAEQTHEQASHATP